MGGLPQPLYLCTCFLSRVSDPCLAVLVTAQSTPLVAPLLHWELRFASLCSAELSGGSVMTSHTFILPAKNELQF